MSPNESKAYQLLNQHVAWASQSRGDAGHRAVAFIPSSDLDIVARHKAVEQAYNTFVNHDPRPANVFGEYPPPLRLCHQHDLAFINISNDMLRETLVRYFEATLPGRDIPFSRTDDEDLGVQLSIDEAEVTRFAAECADHFIEYAIAKRSVLMEPDSYSIQEHGAIIGGHEVGDRIEGLVDMVSR